MIVEGSQELAPAPEGPAWLTRAPPPSSPVAARLNSTLSLPPGDSSTVTLAGSNPGRFMIRTWEPGERWKALSSSSRASRPSTKKVSPRCAWGTTMEEAESCSCSRSTVAWMTSFWR